MVTYIRTQFKKGDSLIENKENNINYKSVQTNKNDCDNNMYDINFYHLEKSSKSFKLKNNPILDITNSLSKNKLSEQTLKSLKHNNNNIMNQDDSNTIIGQEFTNFDYNDLTITKSKLNHIKNKTLNNEYYKKLEEKAKNAAKLHKIFIITGGPITIKLSLLKRGWIQKYEPDNLQYLQKMSNEWLLAHSKTNNLYESILLSKLLTNYTANFLWVSRFCKLNKYNININNNKIKLPYRNFIYRSKNYDFTNKDGLISCIHLSKLYNNNELLIPRCYRLSRTDECKEFLKDYRLTCCLNLIKYIYETDIKLLTSNCGQITLDTIEFAEERIRTEIDNKINQNKTKLLQLINNKTIENHVWEKFCLTYHRLIAKRDKFKISKLIEIEYYKKNFKELLKNARKYWNTLDTEGFNNLWILKPSFCCQGRGIEIKSTYRDIIRFSCCDKQYIVQKYIEKPMLIYKTKFDIRQYILLTITKNKLNLWMYKNCYLRFSSQEYQLNELNKSIHVTNNSVQKKFINGIRNTELPNNNMWSLIQFKRYLKNINELTKWNHKIYPNMKKNIINIILSSIQFTRFIDNSFGFYGADFLLDINYEPILLEINLSPDMSASTLVTAKICPEVLKDVIKIVIDLPNNKCNNSKFELIHTFYYDNNYNNSKNNIENNENIDDNDISKLRIDGTKLTLRKNDKVNIEKLQKDIINLTKSLEVNY